MPRLHECVQLKPWSPRSDKQLKSFVKSRCYFIQSNSQTCCNHVYNLYNVFSEEIHKRNGINAFGTEVNKDEGFYNCIV